MSFEVPLIGSEVVSDRGYRGYNMHTFSGKPVFPLDMTEEDIDIETIAHSLSLQNRYLGHTLFPYSVAQHSYYMSFKVPPYLALEALLHDASEAYCGDMIRPLKYSCRVGDFRKIEADIDAVIRKRFGLHIEPSPAIKTADNRMAWTERRDVLPPSEADWGTPIEPFAEAIREMGWRDVKESFLRRFRHLSTPPSA